MQCVVIAEMVMVMIIKTYSELISIPTYKERFDYLKLDGIVGKDTFGYDRYLNQAFYNSPEWRRFRRDMIIRDNGMDLAADDYEIVGKILVHHINPLTVQDVIRRDPKIFDPENVICTSMNTHNAIHYGDESLLMIEPVVRTKYDTCPWRHD